MKTIIAVALASALLAGCSKSADSSTASGAGSPAADASSPAADAASPAADAASPAAATSTDASAGTTTKTVTAAANSGAAPDAGAASPAGAAASPDAGAPSPDGAGASSPAAAAPGDAIDLPVYPGAKPIPEKGLSMSTGTASLKMTMYDTSADTKTVVDWYKAHLPSTWQNFEMSSGGKSVGTFSSPSASGSNQNATVQSVIVSNENGATHITLTTKKGS